MAKARKVKRPTKRRITTKIAPPLPPPTPTAEDFALLVTRFASELNDPSTHRRKRFYLALTDTILWLSADDMDRIEAILASHVGNRAFKSRVGPQ